jgi:hypothetical protein
MKTCLDCGINSIRLYPDLATPSMLEQDCLCAVCWESHAETVINEKFDEIAAIVEYARAERDLSLSMADCCEKIAMLPGFVCIECGSGSVSAG